jgi:hypothetical protein
MVVEIKNEQQENQIAMNPPKCDAVDYIHFLIAAQRVFTCTEAARCQPTGENAPAHDAFTRLLHAETAFRHGDVVAGSRGTRG